MPPRNFILVALAFLLFAGIGYAQTLEDGDNRKFSFCINQGFGFPRSDFGKTDETKLPISRINGQDTNILGGYAQTGFHFDVSVSYNFIPHFAIMVSGGGDDLNYNINTLNSQYTKYFPPGTSSITTGDNYYIIQYLAGAYVHFPVINNFGFEVKFLAGLTKANYPGLNEIGSPGAPIYTLPSTMGVGYNAGAGIRYTSKEGNIALHLNLNYANSNIVFPSYSLTKYSSTGSLSSSLTYHVPESLGIYIMQITFGASLEL